MSRPLHWLIVGPGALGLLYAGKLARAGHAVSVWGKEGALCGQSFQWTDLAGNTHRWQSVKEELAVDVVLVVTKIFQSDAATQALLQTGRVSSNCPIILMHNGLGAGEALRRLHPEQPLLLATSRHGALKEAFNQVRHTGQGSTLLGLYRGKLGVEKQNTLVDSLNTALGETQWHFNILEPLWHKLVINAVINPLTAREGVCNGEILQPSYQDEVLSLCQQACNVAQAEGIPLEHQALLHQIHQVAQATAQNRSSMLQDVSQHRQTEIDYINGYLVRCGHKHQIPVPAHEKVLEQIHQLSLHSKE